MNIKTTINSLKFILLFCFCISLLIITCKQRNYESYKGTKFEINYLHVDSLKEDDWIEIDGIRFNHVREVDKFRKDIKTIPTSVILKDSLGPNNKFEEPLNSLNIAIMLGDRIHALTAQDSSDLAKNNNELVITDPPLLMTRGQLRLIKKDSSSFTIKTSKNYPAKVNKLEL